MTIYNPDFGKDMFDYEESIKPYFTENKFFFAIEPKENSVLRTMCRDRTLYEKTVNVFPPYSNFSLVNENNMLLFVCENDKYNEIVEYINTNYGHELTIEDMFEPSNNFHLRNELLIAGSVHVPNSPQL